MENELKLKQVIANVFDMKVENIDINSSKDTIDNWDSIRQMNLIFALEESFEIQLSDEEAIELLNYEKIKIILLEKGISI